MKQPFQVADLFCGAGGTSTGALEALELLGHQPHLTAINHWPRAIETHTANHPGARHLCTGLDSVSPRDLFAEGDLDLLWASPECTHHSQARGGKPINDQSRATAWCVVRWAEALRPPTILVENVPEFETWGAIGTNGRPLKTKRGATFLAWVGALQSLGYTVDWRVLCAADYGDPTTRRRLFIQAVRGRRKIVWPDPTHGQAHGEADLFGAKRAPWVPAREIIDWSLPGRSIFQRKRPLSPKTLTRIAAGLKKYGVGTALQPFLVTMEHQGGTRPLTQPIPTITTAKGGATALIEPHLLPQHAGAISRPVSKPAPTVTCDGAIGLVEPYLVKFYGTGRAASVHHPLDSVTTKERFGLAQPIVTIDGQQYRLDIRFRMLQPHELAAAQGFRKDYKFTGTKTEQVKQIGNAVPRRLARALVLAAQSQRSDIGSFLASAA